MSSSLTPAAVDYGQKPSRTRHLLLIFAATLAVITYIDRVCMSQAKADIARDLKLDAVQMGYVFSAFALAYALFEIPGGWLGDKIGARKVLLRVVIMWSIFTALTGMAWGLVSLVIMQFLFGAGEAGAFPNLAKAYTHWLPSRERTRAVSIMWVCTRWGGAITPLLVVTLINLVTWRWAFGLLAVPGVIWAVVFFWWFRDHPRDHPGVNAAELAKIDENRPKAVAGGHVNVPWRKILSNRAVWLLFLQYFCFGYGWYFYITWLPTYLMQAHGADLKDSALLAWAPRLLSGHVNNAMILKVQVAALAGIPLFFGGFACLLSSWLANRLTQRGFAVAGIRRSLACVGYWGAAAMLLLSALIKDPIWAMFAMGWASFALDLSLPISWRTAMDVGGKYAGTVSGSMNMAAQLGGVVAPIIGGYVLKLNGVDDKPIALGATQPVLDATKAVHAWTIIFCIYVAFYFIGGLCWLFFDPVSPVEADQAGKLPLEPPAVAAAGQEFSDKQ